ncbi:hypothetical protein [Streptococcus agalactiae]|uniref:hypothetical protein n=1 Tax=Streptococcus agalactiae TaxID=1311 RepID=UPI000332DB8E|nr:hypothetical protein [Streptococcus agalactiae]QBX20698.1 hypothetical protein Javan53_0039 [Streptococcus phage Javan53]CCW39608.1 hypothetical protein MSA_7470 [Streptococcus agalactiae ILRI005]
MTDLEIQNDVLNFVNRHQEKLVDDLLRGNKKMVDELIEKRRENLFLVAELREYKRKFGEQKEITEYINSKKNGVGVK